MNVHNPANSKTVGQKPKATDSMSLALSSSAVGTEPDPPVSLEKRDTNAYRFYVPYAFLCLIDGRHMGGRLGGVVGLSGIK